MEKIMNIVEKSLSELKPYPNNPNGKYKQLERIYLAVNAEIEMYTR